MTVVDPVRRAAPPAVLGRSVTLVSLNYAPEQFGIAPYATQLAEHLAEQGASVTALVGMPHYPSWRLEPAYRRRFRVSEDRAGVRVSRLRHFVPARQTALRRGWYEGTFFLQSLTRRAPRPDLVLALVPSLGGGVAAAVRARRHGVPLTVFVQDLVGAAAAQSGMAGGSRVSVLTNRVEMWLLRRADLVVVLNDAFRLRAIAAGVEPARVVVLPNWSHAPDPQADCAQVRERLGWPLDVPVMLHAGNMGLKQDLENVVGAARLAHERGEKVLFVLMGDGSQRPHLEQAAGGLPTLRFEDGIYGQDYVDALACADVLLVNEKDTVVDMSLPSKLTSYFCAGRPVLAAVVAGGTTAAQVRRSGGGEVIPPADSAGLLAASLALAADRDKAQTLAASGRAFADRELDRDAALGRFTDLLAGTGLDRARGGR